MRVARPHSQKGTSLLPQKHIALFVAIVALAAAIRLVGLGRYGLDGDEIFSVTAASASWTGLFAIAARDISHPPLYYVLLKLWLLLGPVNEAWVRGLSVLASLGSLI